ncbi:MAG: fasciclin domain-containing protein [Anaerolineae bacterium]|nr:fasciclin domain-containing protein [Anaerolineae bacterium]
MRKLIVFLTVVAVLVLSALPAFAQEGEQTIADIVVAQASGDAPEFTTLLTAVQAADPAVLEALSDPEAELTVFAPTDAAFAALIEALGEEAFGEIVADQEALTGILLFHVVEGAAMSSDVVALLEETEGFFSVESLNGQYIDVELTEEGGITIDGANLNLEMVDIEASNGVIHVIDAVILPEDRTIAEIVVDAAGMGEMMEDDMEMEPEFTTLLTAVGAADPAVLETLSDPEAELTVFAPTDAAFAALVEALGQEAFDGIVADPAALTNILLYHVVPSIVYSGDLGEMMEETEAMELTVEMANGATATITVSEEGAFINDAEIIVTDIDAVNGVIHVIDAVIVPPSE